MKETYPNSLNKNTMISTDTEDMVVYICYVTPAKLKVVDEFYKSDGVTLVSSSVRSEDTYDAGYEYSVSALSYSNRVIIRTYLMSHLISMEFLQAIQQSHSNIRLTHHISMCMIITLMKMVI